MLLLTANQLTTHKYYVYIFTDPRKPGIFTYGDFTLYYEPFYVGKGCGVRIKQHLSNSSLNAEYNKIKNKKLKRILKQGFNPLDYCILVYKNLTEKEALQNEESVINTIGRIDLKKGPLSNLTNGGEGFAGIQSQLKGKTYEEIHGPEKAEFLKKEKSKRFAGNKNPMFGKSANKGKPMSDDTKRRLSDVKKQPVYKICKHTGKILKRYSCAEEAAKDVGVGLSALHNCLSKNCKTKSSAGFYWKYEKDN